ncbi:MAG: zinc-ribbon domain containing protein, partial [Candidatus Binatia bacterium]
PSQRSRCENDDCGQTPFLGNLRGFSFDPRLFLAPPVKVLWMRGPEGVLIPWKNMLGLTASMESPKLSPIRLRCPSCGKSFAFSVAEQKIFAKRNLRPPKRCERCRIRRALL